MKVSCDVSCVQLAMRHCHNAENGGNNRDGGSKQCAFPGRIRRSPRNERGFVAARFLGSRSGTLTSRPAS